MADNHKQRAESSERGRRFNEMLLELATHLIKASPQDIEPEIERAMRAVRERLVLHHLYLYRLAEGESEFCAVHATSASVSGLLPSSFRRVEIPWIEKKIKANQPIIFKNLPNDLPADAVRERRMMEALGIRSLVLFPVMLQESMWGMLWASDLDDNDEKAAPRAFHLQTFRNLVESALQRQKSYFHVTGLLRFDSLLSEISARYINLPVDDIENAIREDLERLGRHLQADRCLLYLFDEKKKSFHTCADRFLWYPPEDADVVAESERFIARHPDFDDIYFPYAFNRWKKEETVWFYSPEDLPEEAEMFRIASRQFGSKSHLSVPMSFNREVVGALVIITTRHHRKYHHDVVRRVRLCGEIFANALMRKQSESKLQLAFNEIQELKDRIESDYIYLKDEAEQDYAYAGLIGESTVMKNILIQIRKVARTDTTVLLLGETGTGKGVIARAIHRASDRGDRPLVQVNCAALSPAVIESELFGHEKGAYTGAESMRRGRFEVADGATLFLDEIGELPLELQAKLLRVLESGEFERVGGSETLHADARIVAATNRDLEQEAVAGRFRLDLWYRLSVFPIMLPPLRERLDDIPLFIQWFAEKYGRRKGRNIETISQKSVRQLQRYGWPGNVRELENVVERAIIISEETCLHIAPPRLETETMLPSRKFTDFERNHLVDVLRESEWKIEGVGGAARRLDMNPATLRSRMKRLGISRPSS